MSHNGLRGTLLDDRFGEPLVWSHYTKNTFIDIEIEDSEEEPNASRRERSAPACAAETHLGSSLVAAPLPPMCFRPSVVRSRGRSIRRTSVSRRLRSGEDGSSGGKPKGTCGGMSSGLNRRRRLNTVRRSKVATPCAFDWTGYFHRRPLGRTSSTCAQKGTPARVASESLSRASSEDGSHGSMPAKLGNHKGTPARIPSESLSGRSADCDLVRAGRATTRSCANQSSSSTSSDERVGVGFLRSRSDRRTPSQKGTPARLDPECLSRASSLEELPRGPEQLQTRFSAKLADVQSQTIEENDSEVVMLEDTAASHEPRYPISVSNRYDALVSDVQPQTIPEYGFEPELSNETAEGDELAAAYISVEQQSQRLTTSKQTKKQKRHGNRKRGPRHVTQESTPDASQPEKCLSNNGASHGDHEQSPTSAAILNHIQSMLLDNFGPTSSGSRHAPCLQTASEHGPAKMDSDVQKHQPLDPVQTESSTSNNSLWLQLENHYNEQASKGSNTATSSSSGDKLGADQAKQLALFTIRLNEQAVGSHIRTNGSSPSWLAVPVDHADRDSLVADMLTANVGSVLLCEAIDDAGWAFGTVVVPRSSAGQRGCFRCKGVQVVQADMLRNRGVDQRRLECTPCDWGAVRQVPSSANTQHRLRHKALLNRMRVARTAWEGKVRPDEPLHPS